MRTISHGHCLPESAIKKIAKHEAHRGSKQSMLSPPCRDAWTESRNQPQLNRLPVVVPPAPGVAPAHRHAGVNCAWRYLRVGGGARVGALASVGWPTARSRGAGGWSCPGGGLGDGLPATLSMAIAVEVRAAWVESRRRLR